MGTAKTSRHILELTASEQKELLDSFDLILSDCDGVVWHVVDSIPRTGEAINLLHNAGKRCKFVSNNSVRSDEGYLRQFRAMGVEHIEESDIVHPVKAIIAYLKKHLPGERVFSLCSEAANAALRKADIDIETLQIRESITPPQLAAIIRPKHSVSAVLFDINLDLSYVQLAKAYQYLLQPNCKLIGCGTDAMLPLAKDLSTPGFVDFLRHLANYSKKEPIIVGKPSSVLGDILKEMFNITAPKRCLFIGDSLESDIEFGNEHGFQTLMVLSGTDLKAKMVAAKEQSKPDYYADSLADFIGFFEKLNDKIL